MLQARLQDIDFKKRGGLVVAIVQEEATGEIIMQAYANPEAVQKTLDTGYATFWSTKRDELWVKGETSGDKMKIKKIQVDCDGDALIYQVTLEGKGGCHVLDQQGNTRKSCFYRELTR